MLRCTPAATVRCLPPPCRHQAVCTRLCADGLEECRKACGGHGYLEASGLPELLNTYLANCTPAAVKSAPLTASVDHPKAWGAPTRPGAPPAQTRTLAVIPPPAGTLEGDNYMISQQTTRHLLKSLGRARQGVKISGECAYLSDAAVRSRIDLPATSSLPVTSR